MDTNQEGLEIAETAPNQPPWSADGGAGDAAFGCYGDGYLEWVISRYYWDSGDPRTVSDTRSLWDNRLRYGDIDALYIGLDALTVKRQAAPQRFPLPREAGESQRWDVA